MEMIRRIEPIALLIVVLGALNWGMVGLFETNVISDLLGTGTRDRRRLRGRRRLRPRLVPRVMEGMHLRDHTPHPRGT